MEQNLFVYWGKSGRNKGNISKNICHTPRYRIEELATIEMSNRRTGVTPLSRPAVHVQTVWRCSTPYDGTLLRWGSDAAVGAREAVGGA
jgi:hypothetical protein